MNNQFDDQWKVLKSIRPETKEKDALRARLWQTLNSQSVSSKPKSSPQWTALAASCLFFLICGGVIWKLVFDGIHSNPAGHGNVAEQPIEMEGDYVFGMKGITIKRSEDGWDIISEKSANKVGTILEVSEEERNRITGSLPMYEEEELEYFPYPMTMYIEHVKTMDTALRYHFFIPIEKEKQAHFTFDYPKLEHAEIFQAMAALKIAGIAPAETKDPLYVKHGYQKLLFPVGIEPVSISSDEEIYYWEKASLANYQQYLEENSSNFLRWNREQINDTSTTLTSADGREIVTITLENKNLKYEFTYIHDEE